MRFCDVAVSNSTAKMTVNQDKKPWSTPMVIATTPSAHTEGGPYSAGESYFNTSIFTAS